MTVCRADEKLSDRFLFQNDTATGHLQGSGSQPVVHAAHLGHSLIFCGALEKEYRNTIFCKSVPIFK
jgi:hypothetical protein